MADPPQRHGPYWWWTRKVNAKTVTRILTNDQHADYGPWFEAARRLRQITTELEALGLAIVEADPRSTRQARSAPTNQPGRPVDNPQSRPR